MVIIIAPPEGFDTWCSLIISQTQIGPIIVSNKNRLTLQQV